MKPSENTHIVTSIPWSQKSWAMSCPRTRLVSCSIWQYAVQTRGASTNYECFFTDVVSCRCELRRVDGGPLEVCLCPCGFVSFRQVVKCYRFTYLSRNFWNFRTSVQSSCEDEMFHSQNPSILILAIDLDSPGFRGVIPRCLLDRRCSPNVELKELCISFQPVC